LQWLLSLCILTLLTLIKRFCIKCLLQSGIGESIVLYDRFLLVVWCISFENTYHLLLMQLTLNLPHVYWARWIHIRVLLLFARNDNWQHVLRIVSSCGLISVVHRLFRFHYRWFLGCITVVLELILIEVSSCLLLWMVRLLQWRKLFEVLLTLLIRSLREHGNSVIYALLGIG